MNVALFPTGAGYQLKPYGQHWAAQPGVQGVVRLSGASKDRCVPLKRFKVSPCVATVHVEAIPSLTPSCSKRGFRAAHEVFDCPSATKFFRGKPAIALNTRKVPIFPREV